MHSRHPVDWRSHISLALVILGASALFALMTAIIMSVSSIHEGVQPFPNTNSATATPRQNPPPTEPLKPNHY